MLKLTLALLLWYLGYEHQKKESDKQSNWLERTWEDPGFQAYLRSRDRKFITELSGGIGLIEQSREDYTRKTGQRVELLYLAFKAKQHFERASTDRRRKAEEAQKLDTKKATEEVKKG